MSIGENLTARENTILNVLRAIYVQSDKFTLIGGYAVDAYSTSPRYSVDCDIVISRTDLQTFKSTFVENGFSDKGSVYRNELDGIETRKFEKVVGEACSSIDLLVDGIRCRQTEAIWKHSEIQTSSKQLKVVGVNSSVLSNVASKEVLIAMKLHSGRDADLKDAVMLVDSVKWSKVLPYANRGNKEKVIYQLEKAMEKINSERFEEQLRSFFGSKKTEKSRINEAAAGIVYLKSKIT